mgnify:CR=1 FL=1
MDRVCSLPTYRHIKVNHLLADVPVLIYTWNLKKILVLHLTLVVLITHRSSFVVYQKHRQSVNHQCTLQHKRWCVAVGSASDS